MKIEISGITWNLILTNRINNRYDGCCNPKLKRIRVRESLCDLEMLKVLIHETMHAAGWPIDEEFIEKYAEDVAWIAIKKLGYQRLDDTH